MVYFRDGFRRGLLIALPPALVEAAYVLFFGVEETQASGVKVSGLAGYVTTGLLQGWTTDAGGLVLCAGVVASLLVRKYLPDWSCFALAGLVAGIAAMFLTGAARGTSVVWGSAAMPHYAYIFLLATTATISPAVWWVGDRLADAGKRILAVFAAAGLGLLMLYSASEMYQYTHDWEGGGVFQQARSRAFTATQLLRSQETFLDPGALLFPKMPLSALQEHTNAMPESPGFSESDMLSTRLVLQTRLSQASEFAPASVVIDSPVSQQDDCATHVFTGEDSFSFMSEASGVQAQVMVPAGSLTLSASTATATAAPGLGLAKPIPSAGLWHVESVVPDATVTITPPKGATLVC